jgi:hypothetical protein
MFTSSLWFSSPRGGTHTINVPLEEKNALQMLAHQRDVHFL